MLHPAGWLVQPYADRRRGGGGGTLFELVAKPRPRKNSAGAVAGPACRARCTSTSSASSSISLVIRKSLGRRVQAFELGQTSSEKPRSTSAAERPPRTP